MKTENKSTFIKKAAVSVLAAVVLIVLYVIIFAFSDQDGEESGDLSHYVSEKCVEVIQEWSGGQWTDAFYEDMTAYFENPIRKLAHFTEYACMGVLVYIILRQWLQRGRRLYAIGGLWVFVSAAADEIHQLFVPGRCGSFADVCLDTAGAAFGMLVCVLLRNISCQRTRRVRK